MINQTMETIKTPKSVKKVSNLYYSVEEVVGRREFQGNTEYLLKWQGYPHRCNTWETALNLTKDLRIEFEMANPAMEILSREPKQLVLLKDTPVKIWNIRRSNAENSHEFLVSWKTEPNLDWISGTIMKQAFPELVIKFYESISKLID